MNPAKVARQSATRRATRGVPDEQRDAYSLIRAVKPLRGCRAAWDGPEFPVTITKINQKESTHATA